MATASTLVASKQLQGDPSLNGASEGGVFGWANTALQLWGKGADVYNSVKGGKTTTVGQSAANATPATTSYLPWILGGGVLLVVVFFLMRKA